MEVQEDAMEVQEEALFLSGNLGSNINSDPTSLGERSNSEWRIEDRISRELFILSLTLSSFHYSHS